MEPLFILPYPKTMEQPNLDYILQLARGEDAFKEKMFDIIKKELPLEIHAYNKCIETKNYKLAAECVHILKHKISVFGLEKSYYIAHEFETHLLNGKTECQTEFESTLQLMLDFINSL